MNIVIASFSAEEWTRVSYLKGLVSLDRSELTTTYTHVTRAPIHLARQAVAETALARGATHLMMLDDDMIFPPDTLRRLLARGKSSVSALAYGRKPPYKIRAFMSDPADPEKGMHLDGIEHKGLVRCDYVGFAVSLVETWVFQRLRDLGVTRWFDFVGGQGEDFYFCKLLRDAGIERWVDSDLIVGHIGEETVVDEEFVKGLTS